jgi:hypothetical protein
LHYCFEMTTKVCIFVGLLVVAMPRVAVAECVLLRPSVVAQSAAVVFSGTPMSERGRILFEVDSVWKGPVTKQFIVYVFTRSVEQFEFKVGQKYLVFAHTETEEERRDLNLDITERQVFVVGSCGDGTREMALLTREEIAELGRASAPLR